MAFATASEIAEFISKINEDFTEEDISDLLVDSTTQIIELKTGRSFEIDAGPLFIDGRGEPFIFCPTTPIVTLTALKIINTDGTEISLDIAGADKQIVVNEETGEIRKIDGLFLFETQDGAVSNFPVGIKNIKIEGTFGTDIEEFPLLKFLQILLYLQILAMQDPETYGSGDIVSEKIGEYSYTKSQMERGDVKNQRKTLDGQINDLISLLTDQSGSVLAI